MNLNELAIQAKHDEEAFERLLKQVEPMCKGVARRYVTWFAEYDDLMNRAREDVWYAVRKFEPGKMSFYNFCSMMVANHTISRLRRLYGKAFALNRKALRLDKKVLFQDGREADDYSNIIPDPETIEGTIEREINRQMVQNRIKSKLTKRQQETIRLYYFEGLSYQQIGQMLGIGVKGVDTLLYNAKKKLGKDKQLERLYQEIS